MRMSALVLASWLGVTSCVCLPPGPPHEGSSAAPLPSLGTLTQAQRLHAFQARATGLQTLTAVLAVSYTVEKRAGAFDIIVNYAAPDRLRFTALKEGLLHTQILFDLFLGRDTYALQMHDAQGVRVHQGDLAQFVQENPTLRTFFLVGAAFFLPGLTAPGTEPLSNASGTRVTTQLPNGVTARWCTQPDTLEVYRARLTWQSPTGVLPLSVQYQDYRSVATHVIPHRVLLRDRGVRFTAASVVKQIEVNIPLAPDTFTPPSAL